MTAGWETKPLGDVCDVVKDLGDFEGLPYIGLEDIESGRNSFTGSEMPRSVKSKTFRFRKSDVLYGRLRPYLNKVLTPSFDGHCSTEIFPLRSADGLESSFLRYWLSSPSTVQAIDRTSTGSRMPRANMGTVMRMGIPVPPLEEQKRIVKILDAAFADIHRAELNLAVIGAALGPLYEAAFGAISARSIDSDLQTLTVEELAAASKGSIRTGPFGSQLLHSEFVESGIAVLGIDNAVNDEFRWGQRRFITEKKFDELRRFRAYPGDVVITIMGTCGRCAVIPDDVPVAITSKHLCCITLDKSKCLPEYLHRYFLWHPLAREYLAKQAKGSIMSGLNMSIIKGLPVLVPPVEVQLEMVELLDSIEAWLARAKSNNARKSLDIADLRQSLLHQASSGQL